MFSKTHCVKFYSLNMSESEFSVLLLSCLKGIKLFGADFQLWMGTCHVPRQGLNQMLAQLLQPLTFNTP